MGVLTKIQQVALKKALARRKRKVKAINIGKARSIGVISNVEDEAHFKEVRAYIGYLREEGVKEVKLLAYTSEKVAPEYLVPGISFDYITKKDLNWQGRPTSDNFENFVSTQYDVLIDLSTEKTICMQHVLAATSAKFIVGRFDEGLTFYDFMIDVGENTSLAFYIDQVGHYLSVLNKE